MVLPENVTLRTVVAGIVSIVVTSSTANRSRFEYGCIGWHIQQLISGCWFRTWNQKSESQLSVHAHLRNARSARNWPSLSLEPWWRSEPFIVSVEFSLTDLG